MVGGEAKKDSGPSLWRPVHDGGSVGSKAGAQECVTASPTHSIDQQARTRPTEDTPCSSLWLSVPPLGATMPTVRGSLEVWGWSLQTEAEPSLRQGHATGQCSLRTAASY